MVTPRASVRIDTVRSGPMSVLPQKSLVLWHALKVLNNLIDHVVSPTQSGVADG